MKILSVFDNGGKTTDRYTIVFTKKRGSRYYPCLGLSADPTNPYGFSQWGDGLMGKHLGKQIKLEALPDNVAAHILRRLQ